MDITLTIKKLQEERAQLYLNREVNSVKINKYNQLITYYCTLYSKKIDKVNKKKNSMNLYEDIIAFKEMIRSPKLLERIDIISNEHLLEKISYLDRKITSLISESDKLRKKTIEYKEKKIELEDNNAEVQKQIDMVNYNIKCYRLNRRS